MYAPSHDVIEVFNCPICPFSDTTLDSVAHHVRRHIKPEPESVKVRVPNRIRPSMEATDEGLRHSLKVSNEKAVSLEGESAAIEPVSLQRKLPALEHGKRKNINDCVLAIAKAPGLGRPEAWSSAAGNSKASQLAGGDVNMAKRVRHGSEKSNPQLSTFSILQPPRLVAPTGLVAVNGNLPAPSSLIQGPILPVVVPAPIYNPRATLLEMYPAHPTYQLSTQFASQHHFPTNSLSVDFASLSPNRVRSVYEEVYSSIGNRTAKDPSIRSQPKPAQQIFLDSSARMATTHDQSHFVAPDATQKLRPERPQQQLRYPPPTGHVLYRPLPVKFVEKPMANEISVLVHSTEASASASPYAIVSRAEAFSQARALPNSGPLIVRSSSLPCQLLYTQVQSMSLPQTLPGSGANGVPVIIPNSGTVIVNSNLLQSAVGDVSMDQLAGLLVVPLKRTSSVATQTDAFSGQRSETVPRGEGTSASTQTDVMMRHIAQVNPKADCEVFAAFTSLDNVFECHLCGDVLTHEVNYDEHLVRQHAYDCEICLTTLTDQRSYTQHMSQCGTKAVQLQCDACFEIFGTVKKLNYHRIKSHQHTMPFRCGVCHLPFESHASVSEHVAAHNKESMDLRCQYCSKIFCANIALRKHVTRHKTVSILYECQLCRAEFANNMALQNHFVQEHSECLIRQDSQRAAGVHSVPVSVSEQVQPSSVGGRSFLLSASRESTEVGKVKSPTRCDRCFCEFPSCEALNMHACSCVAVSQSSGTASSPMLDLPSEPGSKFTNERGRVQTTPSVRSFSNQHLDVKEGILNDARSLQDLNSERMSLSVMQCPDCSEIFTSKGGLGAHLKERHGLTTASSVYGSPKLVHSGCGDRVRDEHELSNRQGQKPFKCTLCPLSFQYSGEVIWHMRDHEKDKPMREPSIGDTAEKISWSPSEMPVASSASRKNGKSGEDVGIILCKLCLIEFSEIEKLHRHMEMFHSGKRFACDSCHAGFKHPNELEWHRDTCVKNQQRGKMEHGIERKQDDVSSLRFQLAESADGVPDPPEKSTLSRSRHARKAFGAYSCDNCHETFCEEVLYQEHARKCCGNYKEYLCHICGDAFTVIDRYHQHMAGHFSNELKDQVGTPTRKEFSPVYGDGLCQGMDDGCGEEERYGQFRRTSSVTSHRCESCFDEFASFTALKRHSRDCHHTGHEMPVDSSSDAVSPVVVLDRSLESPPELKRVESTAASLDANADLLGMSASSQESFLQEEPPFDYKTGEYVCTICRKTTRSTTGMKTHYGRCHGIWGRRSTHHHQANLDALDGARGDGTDAPSWSCNFCSKGSATYHGLRTHIMRMHKDLVDRCDDEQKVSVSPTRVGVGESSCPADSPSYTCSECQSAFSSGDALRLHFAQAHQLMLSDEQAVSCKSRSPVERKAGNAAAGANVARAANAFVKYRCPHCKASFHTVKAIRVHTLEAHEVLMSKKDVIRSKEWFKVGASAYPRRLAKMFVNRRKGHDLIGKHAPCDRCGRVFGNYRALFTHYRQAHRIMSANPNVYRKPSKTEILSAPSTLPDEMLGANEGLLAEGSPMTRSGGPEIESSAPLQYLPPSALSATSNADTLLVNNMKVATTAEPEGTTGSDLPVPSIDCPVCGKVFYQHKSLMAHLCKAHHVYKESYADFWPHGMPVLPRERSFCPICGKEYVDERAMRIHIFKAHKMHHRDLQGVAGLTQRVSLHATSAGAPSEIQLNRSPVNTQEFDVPPSGMTDSDATFTCPRCATDFVNRRALTTHLCRMHGYKRHHINRLFGEPSKAYGEARDVDGGHLEKRDQRTEGNQVLTSSHRRDSASSSFLRDDDYPVSFVAIDRGVSMDAAQPSSSQKLLSCNKRRPRYSDFGRKAKYACPRCGNAFVSPHAVRVHVGRAHGKGLVSKKLCIEKFSDASNGDASSYTTNREQLTAAEPKAIDILSSQQQRGYFADLPAAKETLNTLSSNIVRFPGQHISYARGCYERADEIHSPSSRLPYPVTMKTDSGDKHSIACISNGTGAIASPGADLVNCGADDNYNKRGLDAAMHHQDYIPDKAVKLVTCSLSSG